MSLRDTCARLRRLAPPKGPQYELFDTSVFLLLFGLMGYVVLQPPPGVLAALAGPLQVVSETQLGIVLTFAAAIGVWASYYPDNLRLGYLIPRIAAMFMFLNFFLALVVIGVNFAAMWMGWGFLPSDVDVEGAFRVSFLYSLIFGWSARRLSRDEAE